MPFIRWSIPGRCLTVRAKMGASLPNNDFFNRAAAPWAGLTLALIDLEIILKFAPEISPIHAGTELLNTGSQCRLNGVMKSTGFRFCERRGDTPRMDFREEKAFISVNISQNGEKTMIHHQGFALAIEESEKFV